VHANFWQAALSINPLGYEKHGMAKRAINEGTIFKRTDGGWAASLHRGYENGRRKRKTFYGRTQHEVQERFAEACRLHQQGIPVAAPRQTVGQFLTSCLEESVKPTLRPKTYQGYE
jgi:hypothetical protein